MHPRWAFLESNANSSKEQVEVLKLFRPANSFANLDKDYLWPTTALIVHNGRYKYIDADRLIDEGPARLWQDG